MIYGYVRVSTTEQAGEHKSSLAEQERRIRGVALARGEEIAEIFSDPGVSGSVPLTARPSGGRLLATVEKGDIIIASKMDRVFRSAADALTTADALRDRGVDLILVDMGIESVLTSGTAKLFFGMLAMVAEFERWRITERATEGRRSKRNKGGFIGGITPYGYVKIGMGAEAVLVEDEGEQKIIAAAQERKGKSLRRISSELLEMGFRDRSGSQFQPVQIKRMLERAA